MVKFTRIKLSEDKKYLNIGVKIDGSSYFSNVYINSIKIDDVKSYGTDYHVYTNKLSSNVKSYTWVIPVSEILTSLSNNMLFITIETVGEPSFDCPCGADINKVTGVFADVCSILNNIHNYTKELNSTCELPTGFINYFLLYKAYEYSLKSCNYDKAVKYWNKLHNTQSVKLTNKCNCNG